MFWSHNFPEEGQESMAPLNSVTRAETHFSGSRNQELESSKISILGRRCQKVLGLGSNYWAAWKRKQGHPCP